MVRAARFSSEAFVQATVALVAEGGPSAATVAAVARKVGAPTGSFYHRFESRAAVIATAWAAVHASFVARIRPHLRAGRGLDAALALVAWTREEPMPARFLLLNEAGTLFDDPPPKALWQRIRRAEEELDGAFREYLSDGEDDEATADPEEAARSQFLIFDGPIALVRPHLLAGDSIPPYVDAMIRDMHGAMAARHRRGTPSGRAA